MAHSTQLGCERLWSRLQVRAELGLTSDTRWIATSLVASKGSLNHSAQCVTSSPLRRSIQSLMSELRWHVPSAKFGLLVIQSNPRALPVLPCTDPFESVSVACDAARILDWMFAADAWLVSDACPLSIAIREIAPALRLPCFALPASPKEDHEDCDPIRLAHKIADSLTPDNASFPYASIMVARSPRDAVDSVPTIDSVRIRLQKVLNEEFDTDGSRPEGLQHWRAA